MTIAPLSITGRPAVDWVILVLGFLIGLYWLRGLRLAREGASRLLRSLAIAGLVFIVVLALLPRFYPFWTVQQDEAVAGLAGLAYLAFAPMRRRSRYIPRSVRRAVIARDLKGERFDPDRHHIDHIWPFSKGGSNTIDNLRVIDKGRNLRKRARRPRIWEMWS